MVYSLDMYRGHCSKNTNLSCLVDADCPTAGETCTVLSGIYPTLLSGTYRAGESVSVWDSWSQTLASILGSSSLIDPLNEVVGCPENYNDECWNDLTKDFQCNPGSHMYHYKVLNNGLSYSLFSNMEYMPALWNRCSISKSGCMSNRDCGPAGGVCLGGFTIVNSSSEPCAPGAYNLMFTK